MATYEEIYGKRVKELSTDPTLNSSYEGQVWYNENTGTLKSVVAFESTVSQPSMNLGRYFVSGAGSSTATVVFGGDASPPITGATEEFNGSGWATSNALNTARQSPGGAGTQTAALGAGGYKSGGSANESEEYNEDIS